MWIKISSGLEPCVKKAAIVHNEISVPVTQVDEERIKAGGRSIVKGTLATVPEFRRRVPARGRRE